MEIPGLLPMTSHMSSKNRARNRLGACGQSQPSFPSTMLAGAVADFASSSSKPARFSGKGRDFALFYIIVDSEIIPF